MLLLFGGNQFMYIAKSTSPTHSISLKFALGGPMMRSVRSCLMAGSGTDEHARGTICLLMVPASVNAISSTQISGRAFRTSDCVSA